MDQLNKLLPLVFDLSQPIVYFPIRHHSPGCAYHVEQSINLYNPDCILIEGPSDTDPIIPFLVDSKPPVAIFYSYKDSACYYPMQNFSPEFVAAKVGYTKNIPVHFIDLPLGNLIIDRDSSAMKSWYDDYYLKRSKYIEALCKKENCRSHNELWEKLFEMPSLDLSTEDFVKNLFAFCYYSRVDYPKELEHEEQNHIREMHMADNILNYKKSYKRILAITGGFHTAALMALIEDEKPEKIKPMSGQAYLIPYSYKECDQLTGYASGMPHPSYYQDIYSRLVNKEANFFHDTTLVNITKLAAILRKKNENISIPEEAAAFSMCQGLAALRDKPQPGVYEYLDGIQSAYVKGELNFSTSFVMAEAANLLRGDKIGLVASSAPVPPIVVDFFATAKLYKMNTQTTTYKTVSLDIVSKPRHREQSIFLHRLTFLENPYAKKTYGPDYEKRKKIKLVREQWKYCFTGQVIPSLIERSHMGGTIQDACKSVLLSLIKNECHTSADAADVLLKAGLMALMDLDQLMQLVRNKIQDDNSFISLTECIRSLQFFEGIKHILRLKNGEEITQAKNEAMSRVIPIMATLTAADEKKDFVLAEAIKMLYQATKQVTDIHELYKDALLDLISMSKIPPALDGVAIGLLYDAGVLSLDEVLLRSRGYFTGAGEITSLTGRFLRGVFLTAKDVLFYDSGFIEGINFLINRISYDDFITLLPDLRLAFTSFAPREIDQIGKKVLAVLGLDQDAISVTSLPQVREDDLKIIRAIDISAREYIYDKTRRA